MQIHTYARRGNIQGVAEELASGINIDCIDENSQTPLMYAVTSDLANIDIVRFLVENGANLNATESEFQQTVLGLAVQSGSLTKIQFLLDSGANVNYQRPNGYDVLIDAMHGQDLVRDPDLLSILNLLLGRGAKVDGISSFSSYGETALKVVSRVGRFDAVRLLLKAGSDRQQLEWTPLMFAIVLGSLKDVKNLLDKKANLKARDYWQRTPWLLSIQAGDVDKAKLILASGVGRGERGNCGKTPLMYAIENNRIEVLEWLITEGFDIEATDDFNDTALIVAAEVGATECVDILLQAGANPKIVNDCDKKAISVASNLPIVRMLVKAGEDLGEINEEMRRLLTRMSDKPNGQGDSPDRRLATTCPDRGCASQRELEISLEQYLVGKHRRFGTTNPEIMDIVFWKAMIRCGVSAYSAKSTFDDTDSWDEPVWCYDRFGRTITELPDGRIVEIAGEHEDYYDPDFCIYNDVVVYGNGNFIIFGYPKDIFPPTDFHTATIVGEYIYIIGNLGYINARINQETPVYKLNCQTFKIEKVNTTGEKPGWISRHKASYHKLSNKIYLSSGQVWRKIDRKTEYADNHLNYALDLINLEWSQINT